VSKLTFDIALLNTLFSYYRQYFVALDYLGSFFVPFDYENSAFCPSNNCDTIRSRKIFVMNSRFNFTNRDRTFGLKANVDALTANVTSYLE
jgi:hypothetical protein